MNPFVVLIRSFRSPYVVILSVALLLGIVFRFYNLNWDEGAGMHPDERFCAGLVPQLHWPSSVKEYLDSTKSPLNPDNIPNQHYVYGQIPLFLGKMVIGNLDDFKKTIPFLRGLSAIFDCLTVLFTFLIGRRLLGGKVGLAAATLVALAALHIQQSHFFTTDTFAAAFLTMAFWSGTRWIQERKLRDVFGLGTFFGLAMASKFSSFLFIVAFVGFCVVAIRQYGFKKVALPAYAALSIAFIFFRLGNPMAFMGQHWGGIFDIRPEPRFWSLNTTPQLEIGGDFGYQLAITRGDIDVPFNVQWIDRPNWIFPLQNLGFWAYGWPFLLSGLAGGIWLARKPKSQPILAAGAVFGLLLFIFQGHEFSKFTRYYLPLTPFCALCAAYFWYEMRRIKPVARFGMPLVVACALFWACSVVAIYSQRHTRLQASSWIVNTLAPGTPVINETPWDEGLPITWIETGDGGLNFLKNPDLQLDGAIGTYDLDDTAKRTRLLYILQHTQWIFISSGRSWQNIPRWPRKWPMMTRFYDALWNGELGFKLEKEFTNYPHFGPLQFPDDNSEEALSVYDHPHVLLWKKTPEYSQQNVENILNAITLPSETQWKPRDPNNPQK